MAFVILLYHLFGGRTEVLDFNRFPELMVALGRRIGAVPVWHHFDDKGILRQITINDRPVGRCVDETLRLVQAFQFTDKHGEVCPAGWQPGKATIKPDPTDKKEYFEAAN